MSTGQSTQQQFHSQRGSTPSVIRILNPMSQVGSQAGSQVGGGSSGGSSAAPQAPVASQPTFITTDAARPTVAELGAFQAVIEQGVGQICFLLDYLGDNQTQRPPRPSAVADNSQPRTIWKAAHDIGTEFSLWENYLA